MKDVTEYVGGLGGSESYQARRYTPRTDSLFDGITGVVHVYVSKKQTNK